MDHSSLKLALERAEELCSQVNEGVREKENSDRLEWIQAHVQCEGLAEVRPVVGAGQALGGKWGQPPPVWTVYASRTFAHSAGGLRAHLSGPSPPSSYRGIWCSCLEVF